MRTNGFKGVSHRLQSRTSSVNFIPGYVISDWGATHDSASDNANSGLDMEQPGDWILIGTTFCRQAVPQLKSGFQEVVYTEVT